MQALIYRFTANGSKLVLGDMTAQALADFETKHGAPAAVICNPIHVGEVGEVLKARDLAKLPVKISGGVMACELWLELAPVKGGAK